MENDKTTAKLLEYYESYNRITTVKAGAIPPSSRTSNGSYRLHNSSFSSLSSMRGSFKTSSAINGLGYGIELI